MEKKTGWVCGCVGKRKEIGLGWSWSEMGLGLEIQDVLKRSFRFFDFFTLFLFPWASRK